jgi:hypothetical protein
MMCVPKPLSSDDSRHQSPTPLKVAGGMPRCSNQKPTGRQTGASIGLQGD